MFEGKMQYDSPDFHLFFIRDSKISLEIFAEYFTNENIARTITLIKKKKVQIETEAKDTRNVKRINNLD